jgi:hypothetical protein
MATAVASTANPMHHDTAGVVVTSMRVSCPRLIISQARAVTWTMTVSRQDRCGLIGPAQLLASHVLRRCFLLDPPVVSMLPLREAGAGPVSGLRDTLKRNDRILSFSEAAC